MSSGLSISRGTARARSPGTTVTVYLSRKWTGQPVAALGARFGGISGQAIRATFACMARRLEEDRTLAKQVRACEQAMGLMLQVTT